MNNERDSERTELAPRILSDEDAHAFVEAVMNIAKRRGWLDQDKDILTFLEERIANG